VSDPANQLAEPDPVRQVCWTRVVHTVGTGAIFERRARKYQRLVRGPAFLGVVVPSVVGTMVLAWGANAASRPIVLWTAGILATLQIVLSVWALVARWDSSLAYALDSAAENHRLAAQFERLARTPPSDLQMRFDLLDAAYQARSDSDVKQVVSSSEKRFGLRSGLHRIQRPCVECGKIPVPDDPSLCSVCGR